MNDTQISGAMLRVSPETRERLNDFVALLAEMEGARQSQDSAVTFLLDRYERETQRMVARSAMRYKLAGGNASSVLHIKERR